MFHNVDLSWMTSTKEKYHFAVDEYYEEWCKRGPWFNETIFQNFHGPFLSNYLS